TSRTTAVPCLVHQRPDSGQIIFCFIQLCRRSNHRFTITVYAIGSPPERSTEPLSEPTSFALYAYKTTHAQPFLTPQLQPQAYRTGLKKSQKALSKKYQNAFV